MEEEQDLMGLYQSELSRQLHLRNKQKREWEMMKKNVANERETKEMEQSRQQELLEQEEKEEERAEMHETEVSKKLSSAMVRSAQANDPDTLQKVVELLQNMNGKILFYLYFLFIS